MTLFSFKTLALAWTGLAGAAAVGAGALQASYVPPPPAPAVVTPAVAPPVAPPVAARPAPSETVAVPTPPAMPFENRSLLAVLPPPHPAAAPPAPLPVPPIPPVRVAHAEPRHVPAARQYGLEPAYAAEPSYPTWVDRRLPYPGQYAAGRMPYYGGQPYGYGWPPDY